jgi:hypothetical protein
MRMSHIYQPLMLMELLCRNSPAPAQDIARRILGEDVTQIDYYTERVKRMVGKVLTGNGITRYSDSGNSLIGGDELSEREALLQLCRQRLDAFREHPDQRLGALHGAHPRPGPLRMLRRARAPACPGGGPHRPENPGRLRRYMRHASARPPLKRRNARHGKGRLLGR